MRTLAAFLLSMVMLSVAALQPATYVSAGTKSKSKEMTTEQKESLSNFSSMTIKELEGLNNKTAGETAIGVYMFHRDSGSSGDEGSGQCFPRGANFAPLNNFTPQYGIQTDNHWGGCDLRFAILDPKNKYPNLRMFVDFQYWRGTEKPGTSPTKRDLDQCMNPGERMIPRTATLPEWSQNIFLDMDNDRIGGCQLTFRIEGAPTLKFQIKLWAEGAGQGHCPDNPTNEPKLLEAAAGKPLTIILNTPGSEVNGSCHLQFRLAES